MPTHHAEIWIRMAKQVKPVSELTTTSASEITGLFHKYKCCTVLSKIGGGIFYVFIQIFSDLRPYMQLISYKRFLECTFIPSAHRYMREPFS